MARSPARLTTGIRARERFSIIGFFGEVISELRKVTWPTRQETMRLSVLVMIVSVTMGIFLGLVDMLFSRVFTFLAGT